MRRFRPVVLTDAVINERVFPLSSVFVYERVGVLRRALLGLRYRRLREIRSAYFARTLRQTHARLIHCHFGPTGVEMLGLRQRTHLPMVTTFYGADVSQVARDPLWRSRYKTLFVEGDMFLAEGPAMVESLVELGCPGTKVRLQRIGVDLRALPFRERGGANGRDVRVLVAATFREKKGIPDALAAVAEVLRTGIAVTVTLMGDSGGKAGDEGEKERILRLVAQLGPAVSWRGFVSPREFRAALYGHDIFLSPSRTALDGDTEGGAPVSLIEAQASGLPILSTTHADIPDIVLHRRTGLLSPEGDVPTLARNLRVLASQPELWPTMGRAGRQHVELNHDVRRQTQRIEEHYDSLIAPERRSGVARL
jgi:colanic acid/amylovoran biosynthesis glycosyltransferase